MTTTQSCRLPRHDAGPERDQTLLKVAHEAAENGESRVAIVALQLIQDLRVRDDAAVLCAQHIAENEGTKAALPIASMIQDNARRNDVLQTDRVVTATVAAQSTIRERLTGTRCRSSAGRCTKIGTQRSRRG